MSTVHFGIILKDFFLLWTEEARKRWENQAFADLGKMVPVAGVEPARHRWRRILSDTKNPDFDGT